MIEVNLQPPVTPADRSSLSESLGSGLGKMYVGKPCFNQRFKGFPIDFPTISIGVDHVGFFSWPLWFTSVDNQLTTIVGYFPIVGHPPETTVTAGKVTMQVNMRAHNSFFWGNLSSSGSMLINPVFIHKCWSSTCSNTSGVPTNFSIKTNANLICSSAHHWQPQVVTLHHDTNSGELEQYWQQYEHCGIIRFSLAAMADDEAKNGNYQWQPIFSLMRNSSGLRGTAWIDVGSAEDLWMDRMRCWVGRYVCHQTCIICLIHWTNYSTTHTTIIPVKCVSMCAIGFLLRSQETHPLKPLTASQRSSGTPHLQKSWSRLGRPRRRDL